MASAILGDDEELRSRFVQGPGQVLFSPIEIPPPVPGGISPLSSMKPVDEKEVPTTRLHPMIRLAQLQQRMERSYAASSSLLERDIEEKDREIRELDVQRAKALKDEIEAARSRDTWGTLGLVAEYAGSAAMVGVGWSTGGVGGAFLLAAGLIGVGNRVVHDTNLIEPAIAWFAKSEEKQQRIKADIEMGAFFLQLGFGLAGGATSWRAASQGASILSALGRTQASITAASTLVVTTARVGENVYSRRIANAHADRTGVNAAITLAQQVKSEEATRMSTMLEQSSQMDKVVQHVITDSQVEAG